MNRRDYFLRRAGLLLHVAKVVVNPYEIQAPECLRCGTTKHLQVHHPDGDGDSHGIGGKQQLLKLEAEVRDGIVLELLCGRKANGCHQKVHDEQHLGELAGGYVADQEEG